MRDTARYPRSDHGSHNGLAEAGRKRAWTRAVIGMPWRDEATRVSFRASFAAVEPGRAGWTVRVAASCAAREIKNRDWK